MIESTNKVTLVWDGNTVHGDAKSIQAVAAALEFQAQHGVRRSAVVTGPSSVFTYDVQMNIAGTPMLIRVLNRATARELCENAMMARYGVRRPSTLDGWELTDGLGRLLSFGTLVPELPMSGTLFLHQRAGVGG